MRHLKIVYVKADELATAKSHESAISQCNYLQQTDAQKKSRNSFWSQTIINTWHVRILWELYWESYTQIEKVISKLWILYQNWDSTETVGSSKQKIKFLAHLPNQSLLRWIKREMKVLTWFGRASVPQWAWCAPWGQPRAARPITMCRLESLPPNGRFTVLHCISMHRPAWAVI